MQTKLKNGFFLFILVGMIVVNLYLFYPLFHTIAFASILAGAFYPLHRYFMKKYKMPKNWSAILTTFCIVLTVVLPSLYLITQISKESLSLYQNIRQDLSADSIKQQFVGDGSIAKIIDTSIGILKVDMTKEEVYKLGIEKARGYTGSVLKVVNKLLSDTLYFLFQFILMLLALYALFISGDDLKKYLFQLSPLPTKQEQQILNRFNQMNYVTLVGNGLGGIIQGILAGMAFWIAGVPSVFLWTTFMIILAFIPLIGMSVIFIPAGLYLFIKGQTITAIVLIVWCGFVALVIENIFKPKFVGNRLQINGILLLFYIIAGMSVFGAAGIFYGPIICILFLTVNEIFSNYYLTQET